MFFFCFPVAFWKEHNGALRQRRGAGMAYCEGQSSPGFRPRPRRIWSAGRIRRFYSIAFWDPWSCREESRCCRRLQVWMEAWWSLPWPSPPPPLSSACRWMLRLLAQSRRPQWGLSPPTDYLLPPLLHQTPLLILLNLRDQFSSTPFNKSPPNPLA